ncbi:hypothetical protein BC830DRAFT_1165506 [Chytriomyces sp. MP71]|nr:hypothetical protein BC830DRAFT_1165506 [Chytriomyces sp. MP71]
MLDTFVLGTSPAIALAVFDGTPSLATFLTLVAMRIAFKHIEATKVMSMSLIMTLALAVSAAMNLSATASASRFESIPSPFSSLSLNVMLGALVALVAVAASLLLALAPRLSRKRTVSHPIIAHPLVWTALWSLVRRVSPFGGWGSFAAVADPRVMQIASVTGLMGVDGFIALVAECMSEIVVLVWTELVGATEKHYAVVCATDDHDDPTVPSGQTDVVSEADEETALLHSHELEGGLVSEGTKTVGSKLSTPLVILGCVSGIYALCASIYNAPSLTEEESTFITLGCVADHPASVSNFFVPTVTQDDSIMNHYLSESATLASKGARIILWPETTLHTRTALELTHLLNATHKIAALYKVYIGVTYTYPSVTDSATLDPVRGMLDNRLSFVGPRDPGPLFTYTKAHPVPLVESGRMVAGRAPPPVVTLPDTVSPKRGAKRPIVVSAGICLDLDHAALFSGLQGRADVLLSPAGTWSVRVGDVHTRMAAGRAVEQGVGVLRCDARGGVSGYLDRRGREKVMFRGEEMRESFVITVPVPLETTRTWYSIWGDWFAWIAVLAMSLMMAVDKRNLDGAVAWAGVLLRENIGWLKGRFFA